MDESVGSQLDSKGWQAGSVLPAAMAPLVNEQISGFGSSVSNVQVLDWVIVISQTCDIVVPALEKEPLVEVLHCRTRSDMRSEYAGLKSTRILDFKPNASAFPSLVLSAHASADRYSLRRERLTPYQPDEEKKVSAKAIAKIQRWYALRYTRPAWPDSFVKRVRARRKQLENSLKAITTDEIEVRLSIAERDVEKTDGNAYRIAVHFVVDQLEWDSSSQIREAAIQSFNDFLSELRKCRDIQVDADLSGVFPGEKYTWQQSSMSDEWNFANLSSED